MTDYQQANRYLAVKDYVQALRHFLKHAASCPTEAALAYSGAAETCLRSEALDAPLVSQGSRPAAEQYFRLALRADPREYKALWGMSELFPAASDERRELLERLVAAHPGTLSFVALGDYYRTHGKDLTRAYDLYRQAQLHTPRDQTAYMRLADVCRRLGRTEEAHEWSTRWKESRACKLRRDGQPLVQSQVELRRVELSRMELVASPR